MRESNSYKTLIIVDGNYWESQTMLILFLDQSHNFLIKEEDSAINELAIKKFCNHS